MNYIHTFILLNITFLIISNQLRIQIKDGSTMFACLIRAAGVCLHVEIQI